MQKKHIILITNKYGNGGTERRASVLADEFAKKGYRVTYLVIGEIYSDVVYSLDENIKLVSLDEFSKTDAAKKEKPTSEIWALEKTKTYRFLHKVAKKIKINDEAIKKRISFVNRLVTLRSFLSLNEGATLISFSFSVHECVCVAAEGLNCKTIFSDVNAPQIAEFSLEKSQLKLLKNTGFCIFQTFDQKRCYGNWVEKNSCIIRNPITSVLPQRYNRERKKKIVNFCRTHPQKNLFLLVDAFKLFSQVYPDYSLEIYGATSTDIARAYKEELLKYISALDLCEKITVYDAIPNVHNQICDYSMFLSSSDYEGLSNSMIEAMAIGLPCVCTDCLGGGAREMITDGENGLLVPVKDVDALYKAMCRMVSEEGLAEKCSKNAYKVREELSVENIVNQWLDVIESL